MKRVLLVDPIPKRAIALLQNDSEIEVEIYKIKDDPPLEEIVADYDALIVDNTTITNEIIQRGAEGKLKMISQVGGYTSNISLEAASTNNVLVMNSPGYEANAIAEYTVGLLFMLSRNMHYGTELVKKGKWHRRQRIIGSELEGRVLGVLGLGDDGQLVAEKAQALGMKVYVNDTSLPRAERKDIAEKIGVEYRSLNDLLKESDYLTIHLPEEDRTHHLLTKDKLMLMKGTAYLINVSTPSVIDERVLYQALAKKVIKGAAVDVVESGIVRGKDKLLRLSNLIITPSFASFTKESKMSQFIEAAKLVYNGLKFDAYKNVVNR